MESEDVTKIISLLESEGRQDAIFLESAVAKIKEGEPVNVESKVLAESAALHAPTEEVDSSLKDDDANGSSDDKKRKRKSITRRIEDSTGHSSADNEAFWQERFNELYEFRRQTGHCNPSYVHNSQLYSWLHRQKFLARKGKLPEDRAEKLRSIGAQLEYHWDDMLSQLKEWKDKHGTFCVDGEMEPKLQYWIYSQVHQWNKGKLSEERIQKLEMLGLSKEMESELPRTPNRRKKKRKSDITSPESEASSMANSLNESMESPHPEAFVGVDAAAASAMLQQSLASPPPHMVSPSQMKPNKLARKKSDQNWIDMYKKLKQYKLEHNTINVPMKVDKKLGLWVRTQKKSWKNNKLIDWKQQKLMKLGIFKDEGLNSSTENINEEVVASNATVVTSQVPPDMVDVNQMPVEGKVAPMEGQHTLVMHEHDGNALNIHVGELHPQYLV